MIRTERLEKKFGAVQALAGLSVDVPDGSVFALIGPNGAGKTTAIKIILNLLRPSAGRAEILGTDSRRLGRRELAQIGYVSENRDLPEWMKTGDFFAYSKGFYPEWRDEDLTELARLYEIPLGQRLGHLSRGMRMKAAMAAALAFRPRLLILDEPFGGLDVLVREQMIETVLERSSESTVLLASHDLSEIESFATHVAYIDRGWIAFTEEAGNLAERFREVEVVLENQAELPARLPQAWLNLEHSGVVVRFTDSHYNADRTPAEVRRVLPGVRDISVRGIPLRSIFIALAKSGKGEHATCD